MAKKKAKKPDWNLIKKDPERLKYFRHNYVLNALRRSGSRWPGLYNSKTRNYIQVPITLKNGVTKLVERCFCDSCGIIGFKNFFEKNHSPPVMPLTGFDNLENYCERLFCIEESIEILCVDCHSDLTKIQNEIRRENRKKDK